jgi:proteasome lid subunit RPN8/RPN11
MPRTVELPSGLAGQLRREARAANPRECCGLIEGVRDGGRFCVSALHPARNLAGAVERFEIDPADHIAAGKRARANGRVIIGCYHSHPGGKPMPSATDLAGAGEEDFLWLIEAEGELGAFVYLRGTFTAADWVMSSE